MMERKTKHLVVVSFDALSTLDFDYISSLPNFKKFLEKAAFCKQVTSIYPTLTYPAHTTIITGRSPKNHGIINNTLLQPKRKKPDWYWYKKYIKGETVYDQAVKKGMRVASILWPVTGRAKIHYNMPEIFANRPWQNQIMVSLLSGTPLYQYKLNKMFGHLRQGTVQPQLDHFSHEALLYTLKKYRPDLTLVHFTDLDWQRHEYGFKSPEATEALHRHDKRLGEIIKMLQDENMYEDSTIILLGDHSTLDVSNIIYLNSIFKQKEYLHISKGKIKSWQVMAKSCDGSSYVYIKDKQLVPEVAKLLNIMSEDEKNGIEKVFSREEAEELGADPNCDFMLEGRLGYYFSDEVGETLVRQIGTDPESRIKGAMLGAHGYSPDKPDYSTVLMIAGQGIRPNVTLDQMSLLDEAATMGYLLGFEMEQAEGRILEEFLY